MCIQIDRNSLYLNFIVTKDKLALADWDGIETKFAQFVGSCYGDFVITLHKLHDKIGLCISLYHEDLSLDIERMSVLLRMDVQHQLGNIRSVDKLST